MKKHEWLITLLWSILISLLLVFFGFSLGAAFGLWCAQTILFFSFFRLASPPQRLWLRSFLTCAALFLISSWLTIIAIEFYLRAANPNFLRLPRARQTAAIEASFYTYVNEPCISKKKDIFRILGLGDSFAVNLAWENKNYQNFLQKEIDARSWLQKVEVVNGGKAGVGPKFYLQRRLQNYGERINPDLVLVGFFIGNDITEIHQEYGYKDEELCISPDSFNSFFAIATKKNILGDMNFSNLRLFHFCRKVGVLMYDAWKKQREIQKGLVKEKGVVSEEKFLKIERRQAWIFDKNEKEKTRQLVSETGQLFLEIKQWCDAHGVAVVFLLFPDVFQINEGLRQRVYARYGIQDTFDVRYPNVLLVDFCNSHNLYVVDLLNAFLRMSREKSLYLLRDTHWNAEGNKLAADVILEFLLEKNLLKKNTRRE